MVESLNAWPPELFSDWVIGSSPRRRTRTPAWGQERRGAREVVLRLGLAGKAARETPHFLHRALDHLRLEWRRRHATRETEPCAWCRARNSGSEGCRLPVQTSTVMVFHQPVILRVLGDSAWPSARQS